MNRAERRQRQKRERKGLMRYLSATEEVKLPKPIADTKTLPQLLKVVGEVYQPTPKFNLIMKQLRSLNKALNILDAEPEDGYYVLDSEEIEVLRLLVEQYAPSVFTLPRNAPAILDALMACPEKRPEKQGASENGVVKAAERVAQEA